MVGKNSRRVIESFAVLGGTHTNCAGGVTPWNSWITCEEIFNYGSVENNVTPGVPHGFAFEVPADARGPVTPVPIAAAGRFAHEDVTVLDGILYETEDPRRRRVLPVHPRPQAARAPTAGRSSYPTASPAPRRPTPDLQALTHAIWGPFDNDWTVGSQTFGERPVEFRRSLAEMPFVS